MVYRRNSDKSQSETVEERESIGRMWDRTIVVGLGDNSFLFGGTGQQVPWERQWRKWRWMEADWTE